MPRVVDTATIIKLARERKHMGKADLARQVGVHRQTVYDWENGTSAPNRRRAPKVAKVLNIPLATLIDPMHANVANLRHEAQGGRHVPLLDWVNAGLGAEAVSSQPARNAHEYVEIHSAVSEAAFALRVQGNSMEPDFHDGDVIVVDPAKEPANNEFVVVELLPNGTAEGCGDATFKRYQPRGPASFDLIPINPDYPTITINKGNPGRIIGKVVEHHRIL